MTTAPQTGEPIAVLTVRTVKAGEEARFEEALHDFISRSFDAEGQLGVHVLRPPPGSGSREYGIVRRFNSAESRDRFYNSELFRSWDRDSVRFTEGSPARQELTGLEAWFTLPGQQASHPPRWKMALVTLLGVYPASLLVPWALSPLTGTLHPLLTGLLVAAGIVVLLTWAVMPVLVRMLRPWLHPKKR